MLKGSRSVPNGVLKDASAYVERPRKKLSFREPEIMGHYMKQMNLCDDKRKMGKSVLEKEREKERMINFHKKISEEEEDDDELQSQAMRIVRTVGQAFEVCHKLSLNTPSSVDDDQDPLNDVEGVGSERGSESYCDQAKKGESADPNSCEALPGEDSTSAQDADGVLLTPQPATQRPLRLEMIPPPPSSSKRNSPMNGGETYISPLSEPLKASGDQVPSAGTPLSAHHEIQLLKEQLEQQSQQTQAALAQVHLLRDQLAAETAARLEAQARTHQLLVHNKELLDHITALVTHLQEQERTQKPLPLGQNVTMMPQMFCDPSGYFPDFQDVDQPFVDTKNSGQFVTAPSSPKQRHGFFHQNSSGPYSFTFPTPEQQFQTQLLQRLQSLTGYHTNPYSMFPQNMYQSLPSGLYSYSNTFPQMKSSYKSPPATKSGSSVDVNNEESSRLSREIPDEDLPSPIRLDPPPISKKTYLDAKKPKSRGVSPADVNRRKPKVETQPIAIPSQKTGGGGGGGGQQQQALKSPLQSPKTSYQNAFASALSSIMTLRGSSDNAKKQKGTEGPYITRSTSEKVANRSELMDQVQRTTWARQTK